MGHKYFAGRMPNHVDTAAVSAVNSEDPGLSLAEPNNEPLPLVDLTAEEAPPLNTAATNKPAPQKANAAPNKSKKPGTNKKASAKKEGEEELPEKDKDKYSIYLSEKVSLSLRMAYLFTKKKFSHLVEISLSDMLWHRYQCQEPKCYHKFSMSETDTEPSFCPVCGSKNIQNLFIDRP